MYILYSIIITIGSVLIATATLNPGTLSPSTLAFMLTVGIGFIANTFMSLILSLKK